MADVHIVLDVLRMWLLVKIYKNAYGNDKSKIYVFVLLLFSAKYKFVGITRHFNDCFMVIVALAAIYMWQKGRLWVSTVLLGIAINIKMSAILLVPGYLLTVAFKCGLVKVVISFIIMFALQFLIGLEFLMVNPKAYM